MHCQSSRVFVNQADIMQGTQEAIQHAATNSDRVAEKGPALNTDKKYVSKFAGHMRSIEPVSPSEGLMIKVTRSSCKMYVRQSFLWVWQCQHDGETIVQKGSERLHSIRAVFA